jgi:hypothetical protein
MPEEIKKVLVIAQEGASRSAIQGAAADRLPALRRLMTEGTSLLGLAAGPSVAGSWASLATGAHPATHGVLAGETCRAEYLWHAAAKASKRAVLLGFPASSLPEGSEAHPQELLRPTTRGLSYYERAAAHLLSSPDWDLAFVGLTGAHLEEADAALEKLLEAADAETLQVLAAVPEGAGDALAVLAGPGVLRGKTVTRPVDLADLTPSICHLAELPIPTDCEGGIVYQVLADPDAKLFELQDLRKNYERLRRSTGRGPMC